MALSSEVQMVILTLKTHFVVGHYRTKGGAGRVYIEDMYADKAKKLYLKGLI